MSIDCRVNSFEQFAVLRICGGRTRDQQGDHAANRSIHEWSPFAAAAALPDNADKHREFKRGMYPWVANEHPARR